MQLEQTVTHVIEALISPPSGPIIAIFLGVMLWRFGRRFARPTGAVLGILGGAVLVLSSLPIVSYGLINSLESAYQPLADQPETAQAIVVMGGGRTHNRPDFNGDTINSYGLERLRFAAHLHRQTQLPIIVAAGSPVGSGLVEAQVMKSVLENEFGVLVPWVEKRSKNTYENVVHLADLLKEHKIDHVLVVTHAWHMPRAMWSFEEVGIEATAAPTAFNKDNPMDSGVNAFIPQANALMVTRVAMHEWLGKLWYKLKY